MRRGLRIAFSGFFATLCLCVVSLWIRSYTYWESGWISTRLGDVGYESAEGRMVLFSDGPSIGFLNYFAHHLATVNTPAFIFNPPFTIWRPYPYYFYVLVPHSLVLLHLVLLTLVPWMRWSKQFRLRTLLYVATYVAVVFGIVAMWR